MQIAAPREKQTALVSKFHQQLDNNQCNVAGLQVKRRKT